MMTIDADQQADEQGTVGGQGPGGDGDLALLGQRAGEQQHQHDRDQPAQQHRQGRG